MAELGNRGRSVQAEVKTTLNESPLKHARHSSKPELAKSDKKLIEIEANDVKEKAIWDKYLFSKIIGKGGFSVVISLCEKKTRDLIAAKVVEKNKLNKDTLRLLQDEPEILRDLSHPTIIPLIDFIESDKRLFIFLEYMKGGDLSRMIKERRKDRRYFLESEIQSIMSRLFQALQFIHARGIIHRDIKPGNMLMAQENDLNSIKLSDFGLSVRTKVKNSFSMRQKCGTLSYMAPELVKSFLPIEHRISPAVDLWAAGVVMAILMNDCSHPYIEKGESEKVIKAKIINCQLNIDKIKGSNHALDLLKRLLDPNPVARIKASEALGHSWFQKRRPFAFSEIFKRSEKDLASTTSQISQPTGIPILTTADGYSRKTTKQIVTCLQALILITTSRRVIHNRPLKLWMLKDRSINRSKISKPEMSPEESPPIRSRQPSSYSKGPIMGAEMRRPVYLQTAAILAGSLLNLSNELDTINLDAKAISVGRRPTDNSRQAHRKSKTGLLNSNEFCKESGSMLRTLDDRPREGTRDMFRVVSRGNGGLSRNRERQPVKSRQKGHASFDFVARENYISSTYDEIHKQNKRNRIGKMLQSITKTQDLDSLGWKVPAKEREKQMHLVGANKTFDHLEAYFKTDGKGEVFAAVRKPSAGVRQEKKAAFTPNLTIRKQKLNLFSQKRHPGFSRLLKIG